MIKQPNQHELFLIKTLRVKRFIVGTELRGLLEREFSIQNSNTARKIIQRASLNGHIKTSEPLTFGKGQYIYLTPSQDLSFNIVMKICKIYRPPIYRLQKSLELNNGIISYYEALKITASTIETTSTKINSLASLIELLEKLNLVYEKIDENNVKYIIKTEIGKKLPEFIETSLIQTHFSKMVMDCVFIPDILRWLRLSNIIDNLNTKYRNKIKPSLGASHNKIMWDAFAYTKTTGINFYLGKKADSTEKQTLVVVDIVLNREYDDIDLDGLYNRIQIYLKSVKTGTRKILPIIIYKNVSIHTFNKIRSLGLIAFDLGSIFGSRIYEIMEKLNIVEDFENFEKTKIQDAIESTLITIEEAGQADSLRTLRGVLFEYILIPLMKNLYPNSQFYHSKHLSESNIQNEKEGYEYDYIIKSSSPQEIVVIELKGYIANRYVSLGSTNKKDKGSLKWFFERTLPFAKKKYKSEAETGTPIKGVFITSGNFYDDGISFLSEIKNYKSKKLDVFYDRKKLLKLLEDNDELQAKNTIERFYINKEDIDLELRKT